LSQAWSFGDRVVVAPDVMLRGVGGESVLLNLKTEFYFGADAVATQMWTALTSSETIQSAFDSLLAEYEVGQNKLRHDLEELLNRLMEHKLIEIKPVNIPTQENAE